jgi:ABC-type multidrug transport system permease subunit
VVTNTISIVILLITGVIIGFEFHADVLHVVAGIVLLLMFGYAFSWVFAFVGLIASTPESANSVAFIAIFPLTFISSAFVPVASMPSALQAFAKVNPFTITVNAVRALWLGLPTGNYVWQATLWAIGITAVFAPLAVSRYRKQTRS